MAIATINPTTGETLKTFAPHTDAEVDERIARAVAAFRTHRRTTFAERARLMRAAAGILDAEADHLARTMTTEMGKTVVAARAEAQPRALGAELRQQPGADEDGITAPAERDFDHTHGAQGRSSKFKVQPIPVGRRSRGDVIKFVTCDGGGYLGSVGASPYRVNRRHALRPGVLPERSQGAFE